MSSQTNITAFALQDILEGIADGLSDAQNKLRDIAPYDSFGRPNTVYQVPYLDFSLQVTSEFQTVTDENNQKRSLLKFTPAKVTSKNESKTEIFSSVSGKFVATVPNEGLPQTVIQVKASPMSGGLLDGSKAATPSKAAVLPGDLPYGTPGMVAHAIEAVIQNTAGERLAGTTVEFNFDEATTLSLNGGTAVSGPPKFSSAEVTTDQDGIAKTFVEVDKGDFETGLYYIINVTVATINKSISISQF